PVRVGEARPGLRLQLVVAHVLGLEREGGVEVTREGVGRLAGNPEHLVEVVIRDALRSLRGDGGPHALRARAPLEGSQQVRLEALGAERYARHTTLDQDSSLGRRDRLRV